MFLTRLRFRLFGRWYHLGHVIGWIVIAFVAYNIGFYLAS